MGNIDILTKKYLSDTEVFADAFNYLIYGGETVVQAESLHELDTTEIVLPYGTDYSKEAIQKYRDVLMSWSVPVVGMVDQRAAYVVLGIENQTKVHYAMPVRNMLYDSLQYARQVDAAGKSYRDKKHQHKLKLTPEEFLSGFRKDDRLIPVITVVVYFGAGQWDGPIGIRDMLSEVDDKLLPYIADYKINLIEPAAIDDASFSKFHTGLGKVLMCMKHSKDAELKVLEDSEYKALDIETATIIKELTNMEVDLEAYRNQEGMINMCEAYENTKRIMTERGRQAGIQEGRKAGMQEGRTAGLKEGRQIALIETVKKLKDKGLSVIDIENLLDVEQETIEKWLIRNSH